MSGAGRTLKHLVQMPGDGQEFENDGNEDREGMNSRSFLKDWQDSVALFPVTQS